MECKQLPTVECPFLTAFRCSVTFTPGFNGVELNLVSKIKQVVAMRRHIYTSIQLCPRRILRRARLATAGEVRMWPMAGVLSRRDEMDHTIRHSRSTPSQPSRPAVTSSRCGYRDNA